MASLIEVPGWNGEKLHSTATYETFRRTFENFARMFPDTQMVNCSEGGARIDGMEHLPFVEALEKYHVTDHAPKAHIEALFEAHYQEIEPYSEAYKKVYDQYQADALELTRLDELVVDAIDTVEGILEEISDKKPVSQALKRRIRKLTDRDKEMADIARENILINSYIKREMFDYTRSYARKLSLDEEREEHEQINLDTDVAALRENLETTLQLYKAIQKGSSGLRETMDPIFEKFPAYRDGELPPTADAEAESRPAVAIP